MSENRRRSTRVPVRFRVTVTAGGETVGVETRNVSLRGMLCPPDSRLSPGAACHVTIELDPTVRIDIDGTVLRTRSDGTGIYFASMDEESFQHLRRLVQLNCEDADVIERELMTPSGGTVPGQSS